MLDLTGSDFSHEDAVVLARAIKEGTFKKLIFNGADNKSLTIEVSMTEAQFSLERPRDVWGHFTFSLPSEVHVSSPITKSLYPFLIRASILHQISSASKVLRSSLPASPSARK
jgi:hypothetical protein